MSRFAIVIAWVEPTQIFNPETRSWEPGEKPVACAWLNSGDRGDVGAALEYAQSLNHGTARTSAYRPDDEPHRFVFTYPAPESDPLGRAKVDVLEVHRARS